VWQIEAEWAPSDRPVLWYLISDSKPLREAAKAKYGDKLLVTTHNVVQVRLKVLEVIGVTHAASDLVGEQVRLTGACRVVAVTTPTPTASCNPGIVHKNLSCRLSISTSLNAKVMLIKHVMMMNCVMQSACNHPADEAYHAARTQLSCTLAS